MAVSKKAVIADLVDQFLTEYVGSSGIQAQIRSYGNNFEINITVPAGMIDDIDPMELECFLAADPAIEDSDINLIVNVEEAHLFPDEDSFVFQQMRMDEDGDDGDQR